LLEFGKVMGWRVDASGGVDEKFRQESMILADLVDEKPIIRTNSVEPFKGVVTPVL